MVISCYEVFLLALLASCRAMVSELWKGRSVLEVLSISRTRRWKGSLGFKGLITGQIKGQLADEEISFLQITQRATVPGLYLLGFLTLIVLT